MSLAVSFGFALEPLVLFGSILVLAVVSVGGRKATDSVDKVVEELTLDEKLTLLRGSEDPSGKAEAGYTPGVPRLDIPALRYTDVEHGSTTKSPHTRFPATIALGASFDPSLAHRVGRVRAREGRARGQDVLLGPSGNILRHPQSGRSARILGEDPVLVGNLVAEEIAGIQREGMIATVRYFLAHNVERRRNRLNVEVSERALREVYIPAFMRAVNAGVGSIVGAPQRVNGTFACDNERLLSELLRADLGFDGWVMSAWYARHSLEALEAGLDQEMPGIATPEAPQAVYFDRPLRRAVETGLVPESEVDASVRRILRKMQSAGMLDDEMSAPAVTSTRGADLAFEAAVSGAVLLKNEDNALPMDRAEGVSLAVIGPIADRPLPFCTSTGAAYSTDDRKSSLQALRNRLGSNAPIEFEPGADPDGVPVPASALSPSASVQAEGLRRKTADGSVSIDPSVEFTGRDALPPESSWTWTGTLTAPETGTYALKVRTEGGWARLNVNGSVVASAGDDREKAGASPVITPGNDPAATLNLEGGETYTVKIEVDGRGPSEANINGRALEVEFCWVTPSRRRKLIERAVDAAHRADRVIIFGSSHTPGGTDRTSLELPPPQDELIHEIANVSSSTTVVLNSGGPVLMPWVDDVDAVLEMWYPGQEGGDATAAILTGETSPGGRLPVTFPRRDHETPAHSENAYPGANGRVQFSEGVFVGYRWYDDNDVEPLFAYGHGLTYTTFAYFDSRVERHGDEYLLRFRVRNTGDRFGVAAPQVYLGRPESPGVPMPPKQFLASERVALNPGEEIRLSFPFGARALSYWSERKGEWCLAEGHRSVYVGASSQSIRLENTIQVG